MSYFDIKMPKMGESIQEATITKWFIEKGKMVEEDDILLEIATDKVDSEVPSPVDGKVIDVKYSEGDVIAVGEVIAVIDLNGDDSGSEQVVNSDQKDETKNVEQSGQGNPETVQANNNTNIKSSRFYSPLVKNIAKQEAITFEELETIEGTGEGGRVRKQDLLDYIANKPDKSQAHIELKQERTEPLPKAKGVAPSISGNDEIMEMTRMRKIIAQRMVDSKHTAAHVTSMVEADVENLVKWRNHHKQTFQSREGIKLTFMPLFIEATARALKDYPMVNVAVQGDNIVKKSDINIGIAVALPDNNLMVPVIKHADRKNIAGIAYDLDKLANEARTGKISPDDLQGGTFSISNFGSFGNVMGTPIINQPESAILAVGTIEKKPAVVETEYGDIIVPRHKMFLSLTYDHRVVDGALGGAFLRRIADYLEQFDTNRNL